MEVNRFIGIPYIDKGRTFAGCDCWGLVDLFYREQLSIQLPDYTAVYAGAADVSGNEVLLMVGRSAWKPVDEPAIGDLFLFRILGYACHVGIALGDGDFLHVLRGRNSTAEPLDSFTWRNAKEGAYRWTGT
jgi:cell wall-associated NlpC family hydrolase